MRAQATTSSAVRLRLELIGRVQGVGFRPWAHRLARELDLGGWVQNGPRGVVLEVEGRADLVEAYARRLVDEAPPRAAVRAVSSGRVPPRGERAFDVVASAVGLDGALPVQVDLATCDDCLREVLDPRDRRHRYAFTSCAACGPRYSVLVAPPWDRARTALAGFPLCAVCQAEYDRPADRRFHAETIACAACGPRLTARDPAGARLAGGDEALVAATRALADGGVVAVQGLGGFQLMCHAGDDPAVARVRRLKAREARPLALLVADLAAARALCDVAPAEAALLAGPQAPIVLLARRPGDGGVSRLVAPGLRELGLMLPCTPLHHLLARDVAAPLVATSANPPGEPMLTCPLEAQAALARAGGVDLLLVHDRPILRRVDDSLARVVDGRPMLLRRARGWVPEALALPGVQASLLALGGHHKVTAALTRAGEAHQSPHLGDLDAPRAREAHEEAARGLLALHAVPPSALAAVVCDRHPDYASTGLAERLAAAAGVPLLRAPHHEAHVLACAAEHGLAPPYLGLAWDGTGHGDDGTAWGGEAFVVEARHLRRLAHLRPFRLPGGERAAREPRRCALGALHELGLPLSTTTSGAAAAAAAFTPVEVAALTRLLERRVNAPLTTSAGRLFDAVAALTGVCQRARYEAEAALLLEQAADARACCPASAYPLPLREATPGLVLDWGPTLTAVLADVARGQPVGLVSARFHEALAGAIVALARRVGLSTVVLSGGCFQNRLLLERAAARLRAAGFEVRWPALVPPNDGGLALGQLAWAARRLAAGEG